MFIFYFIFLDLHPPQWCIFAHFYNACAILKCVFCCSEVITSFAINWGGLSYYITFFSFPPQIFEFRSTYICSQKVLKKYYKCEIYSILSIAGTLWIWKRMDLIVSNSGITLWRHPLSVFKRLAVWVFAGLSALSKSWFFYYEFFGEKNLGVDVESCMPLFFSVPVFLRNHGAFIHPILEDEQATGPHQVQEASSKETLI